MLSAKWVVSVAVLSAAATMCLADPAAQIVANPTDVQWMQQNAFTPPPVFQRSTQVRVLGIESINAEAWRLSEALASQYKDQYRYTWAWEQRPRYGFVANCIHGYPTDWDGVYNHDIIVDLGAAAGQGLSRQQRSMTLQWVKDGGGLLLLAGYWTFGSGGGWAGTVFDDLSPVVSPPTTSYWNWQSQFYPSSGPQPTDDFRALQGRHPMAYPPASPDGSPLTPAADITLTTGLDWSAKPLVMVSSKILSVKQGATVILKAQDQPIVVVWRYGKGKVAVVLAQPVGVAGPGAVTFTDWPDWPRFLGRLVDWLRTP